MSVVIIVSPPAEEVAASNSTIRLTTRANCDCCLSGCIFIVKQRGHDIHLTVDVVTATLVYNVNSIAFQKEAIRIGDPRNLAKRVTRIG